MKKGMFGLNKIFTIIIIVIIGFIIIGSILAFSLGKGIINYMGSEKAEGELSSLSVGDGSGEGEDMGFWQNLVNKLLGEKISKGLEDASQEDSEQEDSGDGTENNADDSVDGVDEGVDDDDPIVLCGEDSATRGFGYSYYNIDMTGPICMGHAIDECTLLGKIVSEDDFIEDLLCCEWDCEDAPVVEDCSDTDGGSSILIKGTCTDTDGVNIDACSTGADFTDFIDENWCEGGACMGASFSCFNEDAMCYNGKCIPNIQDSDNDGHTDLDEYQEGTNPNDDSDYPSIDCSAECLALPEGFIHSAVLVEMELACLETGMSVCSGIGEYLFMTQETSECCCIGCIAL